MAVHLATSLGRFGLETIDFQNDDFGKKLEAFFEKLHARIDSVGEDIRPIDFQHPDYTQVLGKMIEDRFGFKVKVRFNVGSGGFTYSFNPHNQHILSFKDLKNVSMSFLDEQYDKVTKRINGKRGKIDLKNAKVSGIFSEYEHELAVGVVNNYRFANLTPAEQTAILLHETGHIFTYYEYADRLTKTNLVMANVAEHLFSDVDKDVDYLFKELNKIGEMSKEDVQKLANNNRLVAGAKLAKIFVGAVGDAMPNGKLSETSAEQAADSFCARFKYGRYLISGLEKLCKAFGDPEYSPALDRLKITLKLIYHSEEFFDAVSMVVACSSIAGLVAAATTHSLLAVAGAAVPVAVLVGALSLIWLSRNEGITDHELRYDDLRDRYMRIRHQYIAYLKKADVNSLDLKETIEAVEAMDAMIDEVKPFLPVMTKIANFLFKRNRAAVSDIQYQQLMEALTHNDLFLMSAKLKAEAQPGV